MRLCFLKKSFEIEIYTIAETNVMTKSRIGLIVFRSGPDNGPSLGGNI